MTINIIQSNGTNCTTYSANRPIKYIVLHYTAGVQSTKGSALATANWFRNPNAGGSADFIVDDVDIIQYNGDIKNRYCWAVGGSKYTTLTTSESATFYNKATNQNCISIEICSNKKNKALRNATDKVWYFTDASVKNAVKLTRYLMKKYNIDINNVIAHFHITGKICPNPWCVDESRLKEWKSFKNQVLGVPYKAKVTASDGLNVRQTPDAKGKLVKSLTKGQEITIVEVKGNWGLLKSQKGWVNLTYTKKV